MKFERIQKSLTFAAALVSAAPLLGSGQIGLIWSITVAALAVMGWFLKPSLTRSPRYRRTITLLVLGVLTIQLGRLVSGAAPAQMGIEFAAVVLALKLCSRGFAADDYQIVILSFLHIIGATIAVDGLSYALSFVAFVALSPPTLALAYLRREMERRFSEGKDEEGSMLERLLNSKRIVSGRFLAFTAALSVPILLMTALLFVTFPRVGLGLLGRLPDQQAAAGFGSSVTLGDLDITRMDSTVVLRLEPFGIHGPLPKVLPIKLRAAVFDRYKDHAWSRSESPGWSELPGREGVYPIGGAGGSAAQTAGYDILLESIEPPLLFIPERTALIVTEPVNDTGRLVPRIIEQNQYGELRYDDKALVGIRYRVGIGDADLLGSPPGADSSYLVVPPGSERLVALAESYAGPDPGVSDQVAAARIIARLKAGHSYSLTLAGDPRNEIEDNPLDRFLFARKSGTCEHFATAATLMLRAVGIPARLVTGFSSAHWNPMGRFYAVRQRSAHSWTEAYLDGRWVSLEATPSAGGDAPAYSPSTFELIVDTLRMRWHKHVVGFDAAAQTELAKDLHGKWKSAAGKAALDAVLSSWPIALGILGLIAGIAAARKLLRRPAVRRGGPGGRRAPRASRRLNQATALYKELEKVLRRRGHPRGFGQPPEDHVGSLSGEPPLLRAGAAQIVHRYAAVRFGGQRFEPGELERLRVLVKQLAKMDLHPRGACDNDTRLVTPIAGERDEP